MTMKMNWKRFLLGVMTIATVSGIAAKPKEVKRPDSYYFMRGIEAAQDGNTQDALEYLNKELSEHPDNGYAHFWIGSLRYGNDEYGRALTSLDAAIKKIPKKDPEYLSGVYYVRAKTYAALEDTAKCLADMASAIKIYPDDADYFSYRGQILYELGQYDKSDADYKAIIALDQGSVMGYMGLGRNANAQKRWEDAIKQFDYVAKLYNDYSSAYSFRAESYCGLKKWPETTDDLIRALDIDGDSKAFNQMCELPAEVVPMMLTKIKAKGTAQPAEAVWPYYAGVLLQNSKRYTEAIAQYDKALTIDNDPTIQSQMALCYSRLGQFGQAVEHISRALEMDTTRVIDMLHKADFLYYDGKTDEAISLLGQMIEKYPSIPGFYRNRGWIYDSSNRLELALDDYNTALTLNPDYEDALMNRGRLLCNMGRTDEARADLERLLELDTDSADNRAYALYFLGQPDAARQTIEQAMEKAIARGDTTDLDGTYYNAACLYSLMAMPDKALHYMQRALESGQRYFAHFSNDRDLDNIRNIPAYKALIEHYTDLMDQANDSAAIAVRDIEMVTTEVPFTREGGVCKVKCAINDLPLQFIFDTGASAVSISSVEATFMFKNGYLTKEDIRGSQYFSTATGEIAVGTIINLRKVQVGEAVLTNVQATVTNSSSAPLLLGQSVFQKLGTVELDNVKNVLRLTYRKQ